MAQNHTPTGVIIDGILLDANRINRREFLRLTNAIDLALAEENMMLVEDLSGELVEKIVVSWPFEKPISKDGYIALGMLDSSRVDDAITQLMNDIREKKLQSSSTPPPSSSSLLETFRSLDQTSPPLPPTSIPA